MFYLDEPTELVFELLADDGWGPATNNQVSNQSINQSITCPTLTKPTELVFELLADDGWGRKPAAPTLPTIPRCTGRPCRLLQL